MSKKRNNNHNFMDTLQDYRDKPLYEVPEDYFEQLQHNVMQHVKKEIRQQISFRKRASAISAAASIVLIFALSCFIFLNKNPKTKFYVHEDIPTSEDSIITLDSNYLAEVTELFANTDTTDPLSSDLPLIAENETIVYLAVDHYVDDFLTENFYDTMYDLESYYDY